MRFRRARGSRPTRGLTLVESAMGLTLFAVVGYALVLAIDASNRSQRAILAQAEEHRVVRDGARRLVDELGGSSDDVIAVTAPEGENHTVRFQQRIEAGGAATFGAVHLGIPRPDWSIVYAVEEIALGGGGVERALVRRVEDEDGAEQDEVVLARGLRDGGDDPPGFTMTRAGAMWSLALATEGQGGSPGIEEVFHVRARN